MRLWRVIENFGNKKFEALSKAQQEVIAKLALNRISYIILDESNSLTLVRVNRSPISFFVPSGIQILHALQHKDIIVPRTHTKEARVQYALGLTNPGFILHSRYYKKVKRHD